LRGEHWHAITNALQPGANCHGVTFAGGQFMINNSEIPIILRDEYDECDERNAEVVVFFDPAEAAVHSARRCKASDDSVHYRSKDGIHKEGQFTTAVQAGMSFGRTVLKFYRLKT
jgi:hypothetical protein